MERRDLLIGTTALIGTVASATLARADTPPANKQPAPGQPQSGPHPYQALIVAASACVSTGEICIAHCLEQLATGDKMMSECAPAVQAMTATCQALVRLAALRSQHTKEMATFCAKVCDDCEAACRKHEKMHAICKSCADHCLACSKECKKLV